MARLYRGADRPPETSSNTSNYYPSFSAEDRLQETFLLQQAHSCEYRWQNQSASEYSHAASPQEVQLVPYSHQECRAYRRVSQQYCCRSYPQIVYWYGPGKTFLFYRYESRSLPKSLPKVRDHQ